MQSRKLSLWVLRIVLGAWFLPAAWAPAGAREITLPIALELRADPFAIRAGAVVTVAGECTAGTELTSVEIRFEAGGAARIAGAGTLSLGTLVRGESRPLSVAVAFPASGEATIAAHVRAVAADGRVLERREVLFTLAGADRGYAGVSGHEALRRRSILDAREAGTLTPAEAEAAVQALTRLPAVRVPFLEASPFPPERLRELEAADATDPRLPQGLAVAPAADVTISGQIRWEDENGDEHPMYRATVELWEENDGINLLLGTVFTNANGEYLLETINADSENQLPDVYAVVRATNGWTTLENDDGGEYSATGPVAEDSPTTSTYNLLVTGGPMSVFQAVTWIARYTRDVRGGVSLPHITTVYPNDEAKSAYDGDLRIEFFDRWDWDTIHHEFGHYVTDQIGIEDNPGGPHNIGDCISNVRGDKEEGIKLAWGEGWPTFFGTSGQEVLGLLALGIPRVGDLMYEDLEGDGVQYSINNQGPNGMGEDNELAVQRVLWDMYDTERVGPGGVVTPDGRDGMSLSDEDMFLWLSVTTPVTLSGAVTTFMNFLGPESEILMGEILADHDVGPELSGPEDGASVPGPSTFSWTRDVGCANPYRGDYFFLEFYSHISFEPFLTIPVGNATSYNLSAAEFQVIQNHNPHYALWGVKAWNQDDPDTGPYLGETFLMVMNNPPVADAGEDVTVECASHGGTEVQLDGTGSYDPDGDAIILTWSAEGVDWDDQLSSTPTGIFPYGTTTVRLVVTDGFSESEDFVDVTVEDTTPPQITCPAAITVECSSHCGVPADDPQLTAFLAGASAVDACDPDPAVTHDAPDCLPLGDTQVSFTATDHAGNAASCSVTVTVEDTTPPEIEAALNRDVLWPPNHKMSPIEAEVSVTDICDPDPTFVLTSIASNESDNGLGDGDFRHDIQGAAYGTDDEAFQLRSERAGNGDGRTYTILYTAMDMSGNTAADTVYVRVPHDRSGAALASNGFSEGGVGLNPGAARIEVILPSGAGFDPLSVAAHDVYLGHHVAALRAEGARAIRVYGDEAPDLAVMFAGPAARALVEDSHRKDVVGLHFRTADGTDYAVPDLFALGDPVWVKDVTPDRDVPFALAETGNTRVSFEAGETVTGRFAFRVAQTGHVSVEVYDVAGRRLRTLVRATLAAGVHHAPWDERDAAGRLVPSGVYFYRIRTPVGTEVRKLAVLR